MYVCVCVLLRVRYCVRMYICMHACMFAGFVHAQSFIRAQAENIQAAYSRMSPLCMYVYSVCMRAYTNFRQISRMK